MEPSSSTSGPAARKIVKIRPTGDHDNRTELSAAHSGPKCPETGACVDHDGAPIRPGLGLGRHPLKIAGWLAMLEDAVVPAGSTWLSNNDVPAGSATRAITFPTGMTLSDYAKPEQREAGIAAADAANAPATPPVDAGGGEVEGLKVETFKIDDNIPLPSIRRGGNLGGRVHSLPCRMNPKLKS